jgi:hypothetical protein
MTEVLEPKPEFQSLTEDAVLAAIAAADPKNPVAVEVARLAEDYKENFRLYIRHLGYLPPDVLHVKPRSPIEAVAMRLATENIRLDIFQASEKS